MKLHKVIKLIVVIIACCANFGCASLLRTMPGELAAGNKVYIGTREWMKAYTYPITESHKTRSNSEIIGVYILGLVDMPLCFASDTLLLPYTISNVFVSKSNPNTTTNTSVSKSNPILQQSSPISPPSDNRIVDVWLLPMEGFPPYLVQDIEKRFSSELGIHVRATVHTGSSSLMFSTKRQLIGEQVEKEMGIIIRRLYDISPKTIFIVLTSSDLNGIDGSTRYAFSMHFPASRISVVSIARMNDSFYGGLDTPLMTQLRLYKMIKRTIGLQFFNYPRSTDINSVMYSPLMSLYDLDAIGVNYF